jgi:hypothetical protein
MNKLLDKIKKYFKENKYEICVSIMFFIYCGVVLIYRDVVINLFVIIVTKLIRIIEVIFN